MTGRLLFFLLLNLLDLFLTWRLMHVEGSLVYESNPLARECLEAGGWWALIAYKLSIVGIVSAAILAVTRARPQLGQQLLTTACILVGSVVLYSYALPEVYGVLPNGLSAQQEMEIERLEGLTDESTRLQDLIALKHQLVDEVVLHRRTLVDAVELLAAAEQQMPLHRLKHLRWLYADRSDRECLAAAFINYAIAHLRTNPLLARRVWRELEAAYRLRFGTPVPQPKGATYSVT